MKQTETHVDDVYVCFLPFQHSQWVKTKHDTVNRHVDAYYRDQLTALDTVVDGLHIIGIEIGNPKRYKTEQLLILHSELTDVLTTYHEQRLTVDVTVLTKYLDDEALLALAWTIESSAPRSISGYEPELPDLFYRLAETLELPTSSVTERLTELLSSLSGKVTLFNAQERCQLLPACPDEEVTAVEWQSAAHVSEVLLLPLDLTRRLPDLLPLLLALTDWPGAVLFVCYHERQEALSRIARSGITVEAEQLKSAVIFDMLHYGFQYNAAPIVLMIEDSTAERITTYGRPLNIKDKGHRYRIQTPDFELFPSAQKRAGQLADGRVELAADCYEPMAHYYHKPFSVVEEQQTTPAYFKYQIYRSMFQKG